MSILHHKRQEREFFAHNMLLHAASLAVDEAEENAEGRFNKCLAAMVLSGLAVEATGNAVGTRAGIYDEAFERAGPLDKMDRIVDHLNIDRQAGKEPWTTIRFLVGFRNDIAHPKPKVVIKKQLLSEISLDKLKFDMPLPKLEQEITLGNTRRVYEAAEKLK